MRLILIIVVLPHIISIVHSNLHMVLWQLILLGNGYPRVVYPCQINQFIKYFGIDGGVALRNHVVPLFPNHKIPCSGPMNGISTFNKNSIRHIGKPLVISAREFFRCIFFKYWARTPYIQF
jgi:hypothetical protein